MRKSPFVFLFTLALLLPTVAIGQLVKVSRAERKMAEAITAEQLSNYLYFIASDAMGGRDTPSLGLDISAEFLKMNLKRWGFKGAGDNGTFFQKIGLRRDRVDQSATSVTIGGESFIYGEDLVRVSGSDNLSAPIVFAGNGWVVKSKGMNPYANLDIKGKLVAVYSEGPIGSRNLVPMPAGVTQPDLPIAGRGTDWADPATYARANGAAGILILPSKFVQGDWDEITANFGRSRMVVDKLAPVGGGSPGGQSPMTVLFASPKAANAIFKGEAGNPLNGYDESFAVNPSKKFSFTFATKAEMRWTQNVIALWEGSDPVLKNEMVAIGAHYDHVGTNSNAPGDDKIWNGADDDGSGTVAVLSIAEALAKGKMRPKRSILLVWHAGEEKGLWGAEYFNKFPTVNINSIIAQLNIDMIGRSKKVGDMNPKNKDLSDENGVYVIGSEMMSSTLGVITKGTNEAYLKVGYDYKYDDPKDTNRFFFRSDHFHYAANGIPVAFWFAGVHEDYHEPSDHADKIDYKKMEKITRTIFLTMWELTDLKERPKVDKLLPPELSQKN